MLSQQDLNKVDSPKTRITPISMNKLKNRDGFIAKYGCNILIIKSFIFDEYPYLDKKLNEDDIYKFDIEKDYLRKE